MPTNFPGALDSFSSAANGVTILDAADRNNVQSSILALEQWAMPVINVRTFQAAGAKGDGSTDDSAAFAAAVSALPATGGTIYVPASANPYILASALNLAGKRYIRFKGAGPAATGGTATSSMIRFTTTGGPLIAATGSTGLEFEDLYVQWPAAFTGTVLDMSGTSQINKIRNCFFESNGGGHNAAVIIDLDNVITTVVERSLFHNAVVAIRGIGTSGHFSNAVTIRDCYFQDQSGAHLRNPGQGWSIESNTFEMTQTEGNVTVIDNTLGNQGPGVHFSGNWIGDAGANAVTQIRTGSGWSIIGNFISGSAASTGISVPNSASGIAIIGNHIQNQSVGLLIGTTVNRIIYAGNVTSSVTTEISGTPNSGGQILNSGTQNFYGAMQVNSILTYTKALQRSSQAPTFAASFTPDASLGESIEMTLTGNITVNAPTNLNAGQRLLFKWLQDGTGGRTITYNAVYHTGGGAAIVTTLSTMTLDLFEVSRDGTTLRLISRITGQA